MGVRGALGVRSIEARYEIYQPIGKRMWWLCNNGNDNQFGRPMAITPRPNPQLKNPLPSTLGIQKLEAIKYSYVRRIKEKSKIQ